MSQISKAFSFLKRNGVAPTIYASMERLGWFGPDPEQLRANEYYGEAEKTEFMKVVSDTKASEQTDEANAEKAKEYRFSVVVPAYETNEQYFRELIDSVCSQTYPDWQLVIADSSKTNHLQGIVEEYKDERICYVRLKENKGISENTNEALKYAKGEYIGLLDHDDTLESNALAEMEAMLCCSEYEMVYSDEDKINADGTLRFEPNFKPDFNFDFLLSNNYICHFTVLSRRLMEKISFRPAFNGAQDYDLFLQALYELEQMRLETCKDNKMAEDETYIPYADEYMKKKIGHIPKVLYHWRAHGASTADNPESKRYAYEAGKRALENFAARNGWNVDVKHTKHLGFYEIKYLPDIFSVRKDVMAVCGKKIRHGKVEQGPVLDGKELFVGMNAKYSGYLHRAAVKFDAESAPENCICYREGASEQDIKKGRIVYIPTF